MLPILESSNPIFGHYKPNKRINLVRAADTAADLQIGRVNTRAMVKKRGKKKKRKKPKPRKRPAAAYRIKARKARPRKGKGKKKKKKKGKKKKATKTVQHKCFVRKGKLVCIIKNRKRSIPLSKVMSRIPRETLMRYASAAAAAVKRKRKKH